MYGKIVAFVSGIVTAFLLDPASGKSRRAMVQEKAQWLNGKLRRSKDQLSEMADSHGMKAPDPSTFMQPVQRLKDTVQSGMNGASSTFGAAADKVTGTVKDKAGTIVNTASQFTGRTVTPADVAPTDSFDPIPEMDPNDPTLVARVESELFRDDTLPKGEVNIDSVNGVVTLRGTVKDDVAAEMEERVRAVEGVVDVVNLLKPAGY